PSALPDTATPATYPLSLHDALPILDPADPLHAPRRRRRQLRREHPVGAPGPAGRARSGVRAARLRRGQLHLRRPPRRDRWATDRSEEHTSELQSRENLVCRLLLEKK